MGGANLTAARICCIGGGCWVHERHREIGRFCKRPHFSQIGSSIHWISKRQSLQNNCPAFLQVTHIGGNIKLKKVSTNLLAL